MAVSATPPAAAPSRGAGGLGRAVIAPPSPATLRPIRAAGLPTPFARPAAPLRPGGPVRPGMPARTGMPLRPGMPVRPGTGRLAVPAAPPVAIPETSDKRRKEIGKAAVKKDDVKKPVSKKPRTKEVAALDAFCKPKS